MAPVSVLPKYILIQSKYFKSTPFVCRDYDGVPNSVALDKETGEGLFSEQAKIEVEHSTTNTKYVHLRFCFNNRYMSRRDSSDGFVVADSDKPEEDTTKPSCTLFEPVVADSDKPEEDTTKPLADSAGNYSLIHVHTGWPALYDENDRNSRLAIPDGGGGSKADKLLTLIDETSIVKLPKHVAFKGSHGKYLQASSYLYFSSDDPYDLASGFSIEPRADGYVRIKSDYFGKYLRLGSGNWIFGSGNWILADESRPWSEDRLDDAFWTTRISDVTVAFRSAANGNYLLGMSGDCLNAGVPTITLDTRMTVQELVMEREVYDVLYRMDCARIYDAVPYVGGSAEVYNHEDNEAEMEVDIEYEDFKSTCFSRSVTVGAGLEGTIKARVPWIVDLEVKISYSTSDGAFTWGHAETKSVKVTAKERVRVPARSMALVTYVGTKGTCDVPFSYTQKDKSATDGRIIYSNHTDGVYTGINCFNFQFVVEKTTRL